jgi:hypothetical protein
VAASQENRWKPLLLPPSCQILICITRGPGSALALLAHLQSLTWMTWICGKVDFNRGIRLEHTRMLAIDEPKDHAAEWNISRALGGTSSRIHPASDVRSMWCTAAGLRWENVPVVERVAPKQLSHRCERQKGLVGCVLDDAARSGQISSINSSIHQSNTKLIGMATWLAKLSDYPTATLLNLSSTTGEVIQNSLVERESIISAIEGEKSAVKQHPVSLAPGSIIQRWHHERHAFLP